MHRSPKFVVGATVGTIATILIIANKDPRKSDAYMHLVSFGVAVLNEMDSESAHNLAIKAMKAGLHPVRDHIDHQVLHTEVFNLSFNSPIGIAAGFDKQAKVIKPLFRMGFSAVEVGGVTPLPQPGNSKPRLFRLFEDRALLNCMGLNSDGSKRVAKRVKNARKFRSHGVIGINISPNTDSKHPIEDYVSLVGDFIEHADMLVMNVSCPNIGQNLENVSSMLAAVRRVREELKKESVRPPLLVKISPDLSHDALVQLSSAALEGVIDGFVISNTTTKRHTLGSSPTTQTVLETLEGRGGLSGEPLKPLALTTLRTTYQLTEGKVPLIGVGGISTAEDAYERIRAGASLLQIYSVFVFEGPQAIAKMNDELALLLTRDGFHSISEAVGIDNDISDKI